MAKNLRDIEYVPRMCTSKRRYPDKAAAKLMVRKLEQLGTERNCYRCECCDGWHLTSRSKDEMRAAAARIRRKARGGMVGWDR